MSSAAIRGAPAGVRFGPAYAAMPVPHITHTAVTDSANGSGARPAAPCPVPHPERSHHENSYRPRVADTSCLLCGAPPTVGHRADCPGADPDAVD